MAAHLVRRHHAPGTFTVGDAKAAAIRATFEKGGALSTSLEMLRVGRNAVVMLSSRLARAASLAALTLITCSGEPKDKEVYQPYHLRRLVP
jgi:hypothetical protein